jgi:hypothetical protein
VTGPEHYREAERILTEEISLDPSGAEVHRAFAVAVAAAQVHATLALAAATALGTSAAETGTWADISGTTPC